MSNTALSASARYNLPQGFNVFATNRDVNDILLVAASADELLRKHPNLKTIFSRPVFLHVTDEGHTLMHWYSPRTNAGWPVVILEDCSAEFPEVRKLSKEDLKLFNGANQAVPQERSVFVVKDTVRMSRAIEEYQCPGCLFGSEPTTCKKFSDVSYLGCEHHTSGTLSVGIGTLALGLPKGFTRFGASYLPEQRKVPVFESFDSLCRGESQYTARTTAPVWMHLNTEGHTLVRWYDAVHGRGHTTVILEDCRAALTGALEISQGDMDNMD